MQATSSWSIAAIVATCYLMSDGDFESYRRGGTHRYHGGHYERLPARIATPSSGYWNITLDLGGGSASIRHSINVLKAA